MQKLARNALASSGGWLITVFLAVILTPLTAQTLGLEQYGIYALVAGFLGFSTPFDFGLGQAVIKHVAGYRAVGDFASLHKCIVSAISIVIVVGSVLTIGIFWLAPFAATVLHVPPDLFKDTVDSFRVGAVAVSISIVGGILISVLMGLQRYDLTSLFNLGSTTVITLSTLLLALVNCPLTIIVAVNALGVLAFLYQAWKSIRKELPDLRFRMQFHRMEIKQLLSFGGFAFLSQLSSFFSNYVVRFTIGVMMGPAAVSYYAISTKLISAVGGVLSSGFGVLFPYASDLMAREQGDKIQRGYVRASRLFAAAAIPVLLFVTVLAYPILVVWMGIDFAKESYVLLRVLAMSGLVGSLTTVPNTITMGLGHSRIIAFFSVGSAVIYAVFLSVMINEFGIVGAGIVGLLATIPGLVLVGVETERIIDLRLHTYLSQVLLFHVVPILIGILAMIIFPFQLMAEAGLVFIIGIVALVSYYVIMVGLKWIDVTEVFSELRRFRF